MTKEALGQAAALLCISNECVISLQCLSGGGQTLPQLPAGKAEKRARQSSSKLSSALVAEQEPSAPLY